MKKYLLFPMLFSLLGMFAVPAFDSPPIHRVTGGGTLEWPGWGAETYAFSAQQLDAFGHAKGKIQIIWHYECYPGATTPLVLDSDVLYLAVNSASGDAWIGAVVTHSNEWGWAGAEFYIQVRDSGQDGNAAEPDMIGYVYFGMGWAIKALNMWPGPLFEFANGNILVR